MIAGPSGNSTLAQINMFQIIVCILIIMTFYNDINSELNKLLIIEEELFGVVQNDQPKTEIQILMEKMKIHT